MERQLIFMRALSGALAVLLIIAVIVILNDRSTITDLKAATSQNLTAATDTVRQDCSATDAEGQARCAAALQSLSDLLATYSQKLPAPSAQ